MPPEALAAGRDRAVRRAAAVDTFATGVIALEVRAHGREGGQRRLICSL